VEIASRAASLKYFHFIAGKTLTDQLDDVNVLLVIDGGVIPQ